jgi:TP901 family phage tail tape measure protein
MPTVAELTAEVSVKDDATPQLKKVDRAFDESARSAMKAAAAHVDSAGRMRDASGRFAQGAAGVSDAARRAGGSIGVMQSAGGNLVGGVLLRAVDQLLAVGRAAVTMSGDLEQAVANISSIKPEINTRQVYFALNEMQTRVPQSAKQLGDALYDVFSSVEVSQADGLKLVEKFARGATAAQTDAKEFGTAIIGVMNAYGLKVKEADRISDLFFNTVKLGVVNGREMASSLGPVTQAAKSAGVGLNEMFAILAAGTKEGGPAEQNINNISNLFQKFTTKEAQKAMNELGVATVGAGGKFRDIFTVFTDLKARLAGLSESQRALKLQEIFPDAQARQGAQTFLSQLDFARTALKENQTASGSAAKAYETMANTFNSQSQILKQSFDAIVTEIGGRLLPLITPLVKGFSADFPAALKQVGPAFAAFQAGAGRVAAYVAERFGFVVTWFQQNLPLIQKTVGTVLRFVEEFWRAHGERIVGVIQSVVKAVLGVVRLVMQVINGDWKGAFGTLSQVVATAVGAVMQSLDGLIHLIGDVAVRVLKGALGIGKAILDGIVDGLRSGWNKVAETAQGVANAVLGGIKSALQIRSPSRETYKLGAFAVAGVVLALTSNAPAAFAAGEFVGKQIQAGMARGVGADQKTVAAQRKGIAAAINAARAEQAELLAGDSGSSASVAKRFWAATDKERAELVGLLDGNQSLRDAAEAQRAVAQATDEARLALLREKAERIGSANARIQEIAALDLYRRSYAALTEEQRKALAPVVRDRINTQALADQRQAAIKNAEAMTEWWGNLVDRLQTVKAAVRGANGAVAGIVRGVGKSVTEAVKSTSDALDQAARREEQYLLKRARLRQEYQRLLRGGRQSFGEYVVAESENPVRAMFDPKQMARMREQFDLGRGIEQGRGLEAMRERMRGMAQELGLVQHQTAAARIAFEMFGQEIDTLAPEVRARFEEMVPAFEKLEKLSRLKRTFDEIGNVVRGVFADAFQASLTRGENFFDTFANGVVNAARRMVAELAATKILEWIQRLVFRQQVNLFDTTSMREASVMMGVAAAGWALVAAKISAAAKELAASAAAAGVATGNPLAVFAGIGSMFAGFFADGGQVGSGQWGVVGERGPELVYNGSVRPMQVYSNPDSRAMMAGGAGGNVYLQQSFAGATIHDRADVDRVAQATTRRLQRKLRYRR